MLLPAPVDSTRRARILIAISSLRCGGGEKVAAQLLNHLSASKYAIHLALQMRGGMFWDEIPSSVEVAVFRSNKTRNALPCVIRTLRRIQPNVILVFGPYLAPFFALGKRFLKSPPLCLIREFSTPGPRSKVLRSHKLLDPIFALAYRNFDKVICQSRDMAEGVREHYAVPPGNIVHIPNPVDIARIKALAHGAAHTHRQPGKVNVVCVGRCYPAKGYDLLLEALRLLPKGKFHFHIVGDGDETPRLKAQVDRMARSNDVSFHGFQKNPHCIVAQADVFVLCSRHEGFPNALVEAMALGIPPVAFSCPGGISEIIEPGLTGVLVPPQDPAGLASALMAEEYRRLDPSTIIEGIRRRYDLPIVIGMYEQLIDSSLFARENAR